jgi:hypothetical protein
MVYTNQTAIGKLELNLGQELPYQRPKTTTASSYFAQKFPALTQMYGAPFVEIRETSCDGFSRVTPISINTDFFAALLGQGQEPHLVVYYSPEMQFYFKEPLLQLYKPTTPEKLQNLFRAWLMRCAQELDDENNKLNLCVEFRFDKTAKAVVQRAKSILATESSFFSPESPHSRIKGPELLERLARLFVEDLLAREQGQILKLHDAFSVFRVLLKQRDLPDIKRHEFTDVVAPLIRQQFNVALRNDLPADGLSGVRGWKDVKLLQTMPG